MEDHLTEDEEIERAKAMIVAFVLGGDQDMLLSVVHSGIAALAFLTDKNPGDVAQAFADSMRDGDQIWEERGREGLAMIVSKTATELLNKQQPTI